MLSDLCLFWDLHVFDLARRLCCKGLVLHSFGLAQLWSCAALVLHSFGLAQLWSCTALVLHCFAFCFLFTSLNNLIGLGSRLPGRKATSHPDKLVSASSAVSNAAHRRHKLKPCTRLAELCSSSAQQSGLFGFEMQKVLGTHHQSREY